MDKIPLDPPLGKKEEGAGQHDDSALEKGEEAARESCDPDLEREENRGAKANIHSRISRPFWKREEEIPLSPPLKKGEKRTGGDLVMTLLQEVPLFTSIF